MIHLVTQMTKNDDSVSTSVRYKDYNY
jgi:hypothetical protein